MRTESLRASIEGSLCVAAAAEQTIHRALKQIRRSDAVLARIRRRIDLTT
jgi:hypothetical protein